MEEEERENNQYEILQRSSSRIFQGSDVLEGNLDEPKLRSLYEVYESQRSQRMIGNKSNKLKIEFSEQLDRLGRTSGIKKSDAKISTKSTTFPGFGRLEWIWIIGNIQGRKRNEKIVAKGNNTSQGRICELYKSGKFGAQRKNYRKNKSTERPTRQHETTTESVNFISQNVNIPSPKFYDVCSCPRFGKFGMKSFRRFCSSMGSPGTRKETRKRCLNDFYEYAGILMVQAFKFNDAYRHSGKYGAWRIERFQGTNNGTKNCRRGGQHETTWDVNFGRIRKWKQKHVCECRLQFSRDANGLEFEWTETPNSQNGKIEDPKACDVYKST
ncbi:unnamed protein product [Caenorhabditis nigoni]